jgi:hypothetical protein
MIREIKGYYWGNHDAPIKKDDHSVDELRYYIMNRPENKEKQKTKLSDIQINKNKLIRQSKMLNTSYKIN